MSAAGTLKQALQGRGGEHVVVGFSDDLSWGPIGQHRLQERIEYFKREALSPFMGDDYWNELGQSHEDFWGDASQEADDRLIWLGSRCGREIAAYLAYLDRFHGLAAQVIRPDDYLSEHPIYGPAGSLGVLNPEQMADVFDNAPRRPVAADQKLFGRWAELVEENAPLRILQGSDLVSAPIDARDHLIIGAARSEWMRHVRVVGYALAASFDARMWVNSEFLFSRLAHLVDEGVLEANGDVRAYAVDGRRSDAEIRLPARSASSR